MKPSQAFLGRIKFEVDYLNIEFNSSTEESDIETNNEVNISIINFKFYSP